LSSPCNPFLLPALLEDAARHVQVLEVEPDLFSTSISGKVAHISAEADIAAS
jgi:hypothetical protein